MALYHRASPFLKPKIKNIDSYKITSYLTYYVESRNS